MPDGALNGVPGSDRGGAASHQTPGLVHEVPTVARHVLVVAIHGHIAGDGARDPGG